MPGNSENALADEKWKILLDLKGKNERAGRKHARARERFDADLCDFSICFRGEKKKKEKHVAQGVENVL